MRTRFRKPLLYPLSYGGSRGTIALVLRDVSELRRNVRLVVRQVSIGLLSVIAAALFAQ